MKCEAVIYKRDTYRYTGRTKTGFELHYNRKQCSREVVEGTKFCWQHQYHQGECSKLASLKE